MSSVVSRKKGNQIVETIKEESPDVDPEQGEETIVSPPSNGRNTSMVTRVIARIRSITLYEVNVSLFVVVMILFTLLVIAPAHVKKKRNAILLKQYNDVTTSLAEQKASLNKKYDRLQKAIGSENDELIDALYEMVGLVSLGHHEEEVKTKESTIKSLGDDSKATINQKQMEIDRLKADIEKHKKELANVKSVLGTITITPEMFCGSCRMKTMATTCQGRLDYLRKTYNTPEQEARDSIVKMDGACLKIG